MSIVENKSVRMVNLDALRVLSMILILLLHSIDHSGVIEAASQFGINYYYVRFVYMLTQICVNCYVMLSGYFLVNTKFKISKLVRLWAETVFYSLIIKAVFMVIGDISFSVISLVSCLFPIITGRYWFITIYVGMYVLSPFINIAIKAMDRETHAKLTILLVILLSVWESIWPTFGGMNSGGSWGLAWFVVLYFTASWIHLYYSPSGKWREGIFIWLIISACIGVAYCVADRHCYVLRTVIGNWFKYNSFPTYLLTVIVFLSFINITIKKQIIVAAISSFARSTFGIYLIHAHADMTHWLWKELNLPSIGGKIEFPIIQSAVVLGVFMVCYILDVVRIKLVRISKLALIADKLGASIQNSLLGGLFDI